MSSLGHTVIFPGLFGWGHLLNDTGCGGKSCFLPLVVALHLGTSAALILYFWRDWLGFGKTIVQGVIDADVRRGTEAWVPVAVIIACIPAGLLGVFFEEKLKEIFASPILAAGFLVCNGSFLFLGEGLRRRAENKMAKLSPQERATYFRPLNSLTWWEALAVGFAQAFALIPGFSRSGMTMVGGLVVRLTHEDAARFSFLMGTPVILAAGVLEVPKLFHQNMFSLFQIVLGMIICGVAAYFSTKFLMKYFEKGRLDPFAYYCWGFGLLSLIIFWTGLRPY
ncbi:undecaprenyl-diphosphatase [Tengunoibacter tsumagoiensis]|uniref:Undecaprenyl-diphosphatase n=1 Tax=Tengunoibacter tsumagoiensis TaxID=2014871 RepID=A0A401ZTW0_9CHLR|nr:undecaprenyl-diphosphatase [Tengunoibacter tsumagoiensis]